MGAPAGNQNAAKGKKWAAAIERALCKKYGKELAEALDEMAMKFVNAVEHGDIQAFKEFADRIDGKAAQSVTLAGDAESPLRLVIQA